MENTDQQYLERGLDLESAKERFMGNRGMYEKFLFRFYEENNYQQVKECLEQGMITEAFEQVHNLKGVAANLSLVSLYEVASKIGEKLKNGQIPDAELQKELEERFIQGMELIKELKEKGVPN